MRLVYQKYYLTRGAHRHQQSIKPLLDAFVAHGSDDFRRQFSSQSDHRLFLFRVQPDIFLFAIVKDDELVKAINTQQLVHQDIHDRLQKNESLGFATYVYVSDLFFGLAGTFFGPKNAVWCQFVNDLLKGLGVDDVTFETSTFPQEISKNDAQNLAFYGTTMIELTPQSGCWARLRGMLGLANDVAAVKIQILPVPRQDMNVSGLSMINTIPFDNGLKKYVLKGKQALQDAATEFFLVGSGFLSDAISARDESGICLQIREKVQGNQALREAIAEYRRDTNYVRSQIQAVVDCSNHNFWSPDLRRS